MTTLDPAQEYEAQIIAENSNIEEAISHFSSPVQKFYEGAVIFLTGGSGFLGKQLIEKLFRSCKVKKIYVLMRAKRNKSFQARIDEIVKDQLFENLRKTQPDFTKKLVPVVGDISLVRLGLNDESWNLLTQEVNVIFHVAATVNFVEALKTSVLTNVRGTREMIVLAHDCKHLKSFVHVSTAYAHAIADRAGGSVPEQFLDVDLRPNLVVQLAEQLDKTKLDNITPGLLDRWPNTYTFTKALAEEMVRTLAGDLPVCIVRPAIVMPAYRESPGWADKTQINGPVGFIMGTAIGGLHVMYARKDSNTDLVPVDLVNNAIMAAGAETAARRERGDTDIKIYTMSRFRKPLTTKELYDLLDTDGRRFITPRILWHSYAIVTEYKFLFILLSYLLHFIPGYLIDGFLWLCGKKTKAITLFDRAYRQNKVYSYFLTHSWQLRDDNLLKMYQSMTPKDQIIYNCDITSVDLVQHSLIGIIGVRKYILKDGLKGTLYAKKKAVVLRILNYIYLAVYAYVIFKGISMLYSLLQLMMVPIIVKFTH